jgi:hypothetical protein
MKLSATIFVEGIADEKFISDVVINNFGYSLKHGQEIQRTGGKDSLGKFVRNFQSSTYVGLTNLVIFDANGSIEERRNELLEFKQKSGIEYETFLFPNNKDNGDLETLLESVINLNNQGLFDCFDNFNNCIVGSIPGRQMIPLDRKTKIYNYTSLLNPKNPEYAKEKERDYRNKDHWDLDSNHLAPLYSFLKPYFNQDGN